MAKTNVNTSDLLVRPSSSTRKKYLEETPEAIQVSYFRFYMEGFKKGVNTTALIEQFMDKYGTDRSCALKWRNKALEALSQYAVKDAEKIRGVQMERLEYIYNLAVENHQLKTAQSILDTMNKLMGLYKDSTVIVQPVTQFNFGDDKTIRITQNPYAHELDGVETPEDINAKANEIMEDLNAFNWREDNS